MHTSQVPALQLSYTSNPGLCFLMCELGFSLSKGQFLNLVKEEGLVFLLIDRVPCQPQSNYSHCFHASLCATKGKTTSASWPCDIRAPQSFIYSYDLPSGVKRRFISLGMIVPERRQHPWNGEGGCLGCDFLEGYLYRVLVQLLPLTTQIWKPVALEGRVQEQS